jgi:hypothetical protein
MSVGRLRTTMLRDTVQSVVFLATVTVDDDDDATTPSVYKAVFYSEIAAHVWVRETLIDEIVDVLEEGRYSDRQRARFGDLCQTTSLSRFYVCLDDFLANNHMRAMFTWTIEQMSVREGPTIVQTRNVFYDDDGDPAP